MSLLVVVLERLSEGRLYDCNSKQASLTLVDGKEVRNIL